MSHIVSIQTKINDPIAIAAACTRLGLAAPVQGTAKLYSGEVTGLLVQLPDWHYPIVIDTANSSIKLDNFQGNWGDQRQLDRFLQSYAIEKCRLEAKAKGFAISESQLQDGSVMLQIREGY